jgi:putative peptidoglycan lipid II flippase
MSIALANNKLTGANIATASALNLATYLAFQLCIINALGPGSETDAFVASSTIPQFILAVVGGSFTYVLVPMLSTKTTDEQRVYSWSLLYSSGCIFTAAALFLYATADFWLRLTVPGFSEASVSLALSLFSVQVLSLPLTAISAVQFALHQGRERFAIAEYKLFLGNVLAIAMVLYLIPSHGVYGAVWAAVCRLLFHCFLLNSELGTPTKVRGSFASLRDAFRRAKPLLIGSAYYRTEPVIDRYLLSNASAGLLTIYYLVDQVYAGTSQFLNKWLTSPVIPSLSKCHEAGQLESFRRIYLRTVLRNVATSLAILFALVLSAVVALAPVVELLGGKPSDWQNVWWVLVLLSGVLIGSAGGQIASAAFYARNDTTTPSKISIIAYTIFVPCKVFAFFQWGVPGLAIVASAYSLNNFLWQLALMSGKLPKERSQ